MVRALVAASFLWGTASAATFNKDVLPILQAHCQSCHRPGEVAPMSLLDYKTTRPWARAIKSAVLTRRMPPWPADRRYGKFSNDPALSRAEIETLADWAGCGAPEGDPKDAPAPLTWPDDWRIPPDIVLNLPPSPPIPAKGVVELMVVELPSGFTKDTWVTSVEIRPGNRAVVHHVLFEVEPPRADRVYREWFWNDEKRDQEGVARKRIGRKQRLLDIAGVEAVWLPGSSPADYRVYDAAKLFPAGSDFRIQMHYTPNGTAATDSTRIGLTLAKAPPKRRFLTLNPTALRDASHFHIPAGDPNWETRTEIEFHDEAQIVWFLPHMHLRGKDMTFRLAYPDGSTDTALSVKWDFGWQFGYNLASPIPVRTGTTLQVTAHFDNSANNPLNPNPSRDVWWGDQTWEEMMVPWVGVLVGPRVDPRRVATYSRQLLSTR